MWSEPCVVNEVWAGGLLEDVGLIVPEDVEENEPFPSLPGFSGDELEGK